MSDKILLTGGLGYIGSHVAVELMEQGYDVILVDNLSNSHKCVVRQIEKIVGHNVEYYFMDVCDIYALRSLFRNSDIDAVIHLAGFKSVSESVMNPIKYYNNNVFATLSILSVMGEFNVKKFVMSSSASVYGTANVAPYDETDCVGMCTNPYGWTKFINEQIIKDLSCSDEYFSAAILRYFNPIGAHGSGLIGEFPNAKPNNLMPYITQVASGQEAKLFIYGGDYPTVDGTCVRDYIHVVDLAKGHVAALQYLDGRTGVEIFNLGTGKGHTVLEVVKTFETVTGIEIPFEIIGRRVGDMDVCFAKIDKSKLYLGWEAKLELSEMCQDAWKWQRYMEHFGEKVGINDL